MCKIPRSLVAACAASRLMATPCEFRGVGGRGDRTRLGGASGARNPGSRMVVELASGDQAGRCHWLKYAVRANASEFAVAAPGWYCDARAEKLGAAMRTCGLRGATVRGERPDEGKNSHISPMRIRSALPGTSCSDRSSEGACLRSLLSNASCSA